MPDPAGGAYSAAPDPVAGGEGASYHLPSLEKKSRMRPWS